MEDMTSVAGMVANWLSSGKGAVVNDPNNVSVVDTSNTLPNDGSYVWEIQGQNPSQFANPFTGQAKQSPLTNRLSQLLNATFPDSNINMISGKIHPSFVEMEKATLTLEKVKSQILKAAHASNITKNCSMDDTYQSITIDEYERAHSIVQRFRCIDNSRITADNRKDLLLDREGIITVLSAVDEVEGVGQYLATQDSTNFEIGLSLLASMAVDESK